MYEGYAEGNFPTRRSIHTSSSSMPAVSSATRRSRGGGCKVARASLLVGLLMTTVVVPLSGFVGPDSSVSLPTRTFGTPVGAATWASGPRDEAVSVLEGSAAAASRAKVRAPLEVSHCVPAGTAANGTRILTQSSEIVWPMKQDVFTITSSFGKRVSPISGEYLTHEGIDMSAPLNTPIYAVADGDVVEVSENSHSGTYVKLKHKKADGTVFYSAYLHEYPEQILVKEGQHVKAGEQIGAVGSNGWSTGPHLHFEIHDSTDTPIDSHTWLEDQGAAFIGQECQ